MSEKQHICDRMIEVIEKNLVSVASFEKKAADSGLKVSGGYLRKAAKNQTNIGVDLIDYFLGVYQDVDAHWLLTGKKISGNTDKNNTPVVKSGDNNGKFNGSVEDVLTHLIEGDTKYILMNKELILEKYRLVSIDKINEEKKDSEREHQKLLEEIAQKKQEVASQQATITKIMETMAEIVKKLPEPPAHLVQVDKAQ